MNVPAAPAVEPMPSRHMLIAHASCTALFWSVFLWGFWHFGLDYLGLNATVFLGLLALVIWSAHPEHPFFSRHNFAWSLPFIPICLAYTIYANPFWRAVNVIILPVAFGIFFSASPELHAATNRWRVARVMRDAFTPIVGWFSSLGDAVARHLATFIPFCRVDPARLQLISSICKGLTVLFVLSFMIVIPLLASADQRFADAISNLLEHFDWIAQELLRSELPIRTCVTVMLSCVLVALTLTLGRPAPPCEHRGKEGDRIVHAVVLGGTFALYALFLGLQLSTLWPSTLPEDFRTTERLVKGGFWELIVLSGVNLGLFIWTYRNSVQGLGALLLAFTLSALLLVASAAQRMFLYVTLYGFSHQKFYAAYTVLFCIVLYGYLLVSLARCREIDATKAALSLFLWMYAAVSIFPVEHFVFSANTRLADAPYSRIDLEELKELSRDVAMQVRHAAQHDPEFARSYMWGNWLKEKELERQALPWFAENIASSL